MSALHALKFSAKKRKMIFLFRPCVKETIFIKLVPSDY